MSETLMERAARIAAIGVNATVEASSLPERLRRPVALYLLVTGCNLPGAAVAPAFGCTKQNVSKHLTRVETAREDPRLDREIARLEEKLFGGTW